MKKIITKRIAKNILKSFLKNEIVREELVGNQDLSYHNFMKFASISISERKGYISNAQLNKKLDELNPKKEDYDERYNEFKIKVSQLLENHSIDKKEIAELINERDNLKSVLTNLKDEIMQIRSSIQEQHETLVSTYWEDFNKRTSTKEPILGINKSYKDFVDRNPIDLEIESQINNFRKIFFDDGEDHILKRCMNEIHAIRNASPGKRKNELNKIIQSVYNNWFGQFLDLIKFNDDKNKIEIPQTLETVIMKIDELLPGVDSRFIKTGDEGKENIPRVKEFIDKYLLENNIKIENVDNKSRLEKEMQLAFNKLYPNHSRRLSSFHKELPRKS